jgi:ferri-bacillibactin esterase
MLAQRTLLGLVATALLSLVLEAQAPASAPGPRERARPSSSSHIVAQTAGPATIEGAERYTLIAAKTKNTYLIDVLRVNSTLTKVPEGYKLPVIYVLDGNSLLPLVGYIVNTSVPFSAQMPAALVVSIGYVSDPTLTRAQNLANSLSWRNRDFTPAMSPGRPAPRGMANAGGAADFLAFLNQDLKPFVASRYPVDTQDQTLAGHSLRRAHQLSCLF